MLAALFGQKKQGKRVTDAADSSINHCMGGIVANNNHFVFYPVRYWC